MLPLLALCRTDEYLDVWKEGPDLVRRFAKLLLDQGHPTLALETATQGLRGYSNDPYLLYYRALALARCDSPARALRTARTLADRPDFADLPDALRVDALSLIGRVYKDLAARTDDPEQRRHRYRAALNGYRLAYQVSHDPFPGITPPPWPAWRATRHLPENRLPGPRHGPGQRGGRPRLLVARHPR